MALLLKRWGLKRASAALRLTERPKRLNFIRIFVTVVTSEQPEMPSCTQSTTKKPFERLPKTVIPHVYNLRLKPDLEKFTVDGRVNIDITVALPTDTILLNAVDLSFNSVTFKRHGDETKAQMWTIDKDTEVATVVFPSVIEPGMGQLSFDFTGILSEKLNGFYRSEYSTPQGEIRYAATTQFESTHARQAFPCWDEPAIKAKFNVTLVVPKDRVALSNMNVISEEPDEDSSKKVVKFDTSPIMSTYLLAFVVGEYDYIEDVTSNGVKVRVYTPIGKKEQGRLALNAAVKGLPFYEKYYGIAYPLPKMDLIAIADFDAGAMENWGLVTFREVCILFDEKNTSSFRKQFIVIVVAHELAHQWFGNLVTMDWWTHLWLNEGFASFMEYLCTANLHPEFDIWMQFVTDVTTRALDLDGLHTSHPIEVPVGHPSEVTEIFDDISYRKGAAVIRMLHDYVGDECFSQAINYYLKKHSYKNTVTEDLWHALEDVSKKPVGNVMNTWTKQKGFPVISVSSKQDGNNRILTLTQEKFCSNGKSNEMDKHSLWLVPISVMTAKGEASRFLMESQSMNVVLENVAADQWIKLNPSSVGFYRVQYTPEMYTQLLPSLRDKSLPPLDRLSLQNDLFALVQCGRANTVDLLKTIEAFVEEDNYAVWDSIDSCLGVLNSLFSHTDFQDNFHAYGRRLLSKINSKLGWDPIPNESHLQAMLRAIIIGRLVHFNDKATTAEAKIRFDAYVNDGVIIPADIRSAVYRAVAKDADDSTFETFFNLFRKSDLNEEKNRIASSMASVKDLPKIQKLLDFSLSKEVRSQDAPSILLSVANNKDGRETAWRFFQENLKEFQKRYEGGFLLCHLVENITKPFASEEKAVEIEKFFAANPVAQAERPLQQSLESIRLKADWLTRDSTAIKSFLSTYV